MERKKRAPAGEGTLSAPETVPTPGLPKLKAFSENDQGALISDAWRILRDLITTGEVTLLGGKVLTPATKDLIRVAQYVARLKPPRQRKVPLFEDFKAAQTGGKEEPK